MASHSDPVIGLLGGTGLEGRGLALRWCAAGHLVVIGSRDAVRARDVARRTGDVLHGCAGARRPTGTDNRAAAEQASVAVLCVPYSAHAAVLQEVGRQLAGKVLVDVAVPLEPPNVWVASPPEAGSAAAEAQALLGSGTRVVAAFQNVAAGKLLSLDEPIDCDVLVCGDDPDAKALTLRLVSDARMRGLDAGPLANARVVDGLTSVLIGINRRYGSTSAGLRITNLPDSGRPAS